MSGRVARLVEDYLPSFAWQSAFEIMIMLEVVDEAINYDSLKHTLGRMAKTGQIECCPIGRRPCGARRNEEFYYRYPPAKERPRHRRGQAAHRRVIALLDEKLQSRYPVTRYATRVYSPAFAAPSLAGRSLGVTA